MLFSFSSAAQQPRSAYVHVPFCKHRCGYCNFTLVANREDLIDEYIDCLTREIEQQLAAPVPMDTLFLGGGTPTHLGFDQLQRLLELLRRWLPLEQGGEYSCEANPLDCSADKLRLLRDYGVNRLSLGGQSFNDAKLQTLERDHSGDQLLQTVIESSRYFDNLSLDLIFAAPGETVEDWKKEIDQAIHLPITHLSTYGLTIEPGANFWGRMLKGDIHELDADAQLAMYDYTMEQLHRAGWEHYEVSNFCKSGFQCRHNQAYWQGLPWLAFGPGAASFLPAQFTNMAKELTTELESDVASQQSRWTDNWIRATNHRSTTQYIRLIRSGASPVHERDVLSLETVVRERLVFGLRQLAGVNMAELAKMWPGDLEQLFSPYLDRYIESGWLERVDGRLRLTRAGLVISDGLWPDLLA